MAVSRGGGGAGERRQRTSKECRDKGRRKGGVGNTMSLRECRLAGK